jgi:phosphate-selective porin OprO/OprP
MKRIAGGLALGVGLLALAPAALGNDAAPGGGKAETERRLEEVLAELEAQRLEIQGLKASLQAPEGGGSVGDAVKEYLASEEGKKLLGKGATDFTASWKEGLVLETSDKAFSLKIQGRIMYDMVFPDADDDVEAAVGDFDATAGFRRLRVEMGGTIHDVIYFQNTVDFSATPHALKDNYIGIKGLPGGLHFQAGYFKEPVGLEELTSSKYITFMERSIATNAFAPAHNMGVMVFASHLEDRLNWAFGDFSDHAAGGVGPTQITHNFTGRVCGAPILDKEKKMVLHVGGSFQDRSPESENDRLRVRPEMPFVPRTEDSGTFGVDTEMILGLEAAFVHGPFSVQGEYFTGSFEDHPDAPGASPDYSGYYLYGSWFATGESRPYKGGTFQRIKPKKNFDLKGGTGALELKARFAAVDLSDDGQGSGTGHDVTVGANWHLNPNTRVMLEYVLHTIHQVGDVSAIQMRLQVDF